MRGPRPRHEVRLDEKQREACEELVRSGRSEQRLVLRARIALLSEAGWSNESIAAEVGCSARIVRKWRRRWSEKGFSIQDAHRSGRPPLFSPPAQGSGSGDRL
jgi:transposase-like protein